MKAGYLNRGLFMLFASTALLLGSCKDKEATPADETTADTITDEEMSSAPLGDTIATDTDTIVKTGTENDTKENPVGEQVP